MYKNMPQNGASRANQAIIEFNQKNILYLTGTWLWSHIEENMLYATINQIIATLNKHSNKNTIIIIDGSKIQSLDTTGSYFIHKILQLMLMHKFIINSVKLQKLHQDLYTDIVKVIDNQQYTKNHHSTTNILSTIGLQGFLISNIIKDALIFLGQFCLNLIHLIKSPLSVNWKETTRTIKDAGMYGVWVTSLLGFLIGVTLAYEMSPQFIRYGANVYIVNFLGISLLKEVTPLLTAIIIAGRTGASITAEIGVMQIEEEIDAIQTMGISPVKRLVLPKVLGVVVVTPLLTAIADILSMLGGAVVANSSLDITYSLFLHRLQNYVSINNYTGGIIKSVFFAVAIALTACFCGFRVKSTANSIGEQTTKSVVWGIIAILTIDAIFAIIFKLLKI